MEKLSSVFKQLQNSISSRKIDFELLQILKQTVTSFNLGKDEFLQFVKTMTQVYELSNNDKLYQIKRTSISISEMAIELKLLVCKMMTLIILYFQKQQSTSSIPFEILSEAVEIMIICSRVCLNEGSNKYISLIQDFYKFVHSPYDMVSIELKKNVKFLHQINVLELMRYKCENESFNIVEFKKRLSQVISFEQYNLPDYKSFVQNIIMEILLKSIKNGKLKPDGIKQFYPYLSEENQKDLNFLVYDPENLMKNMQTGSQFLQIYKQVKSNGIESINIEFLEDFIKNEKNFHDDRVFEIAGLTSQPIILQIWFSILNSKKQKSPIMQKALICYIHIVDSIMYHNKYPNKNILEGILRLSNSVTFALLTQKKSSFTSQPVLHIIKTLVKVLTFLCFSLYEKWDEIKDFGQRTVLLCSRYQCMEVSKVIYAVILYYCLVKKIKAQDIYEKFVAHHNNQKSGEIYKLLSCAYEVQNSGEQGLGDLRVDQALKTQMRKQPFVAILFAKKNEDMTIFQIEPNQYKEFPQKFYIYSEMLKKYRTNESSVRKILSHLEDFLIKTNSEEFQAYMQISEQQNISIQELFLIMIEILEERDLKNKSMKQDNKKQQKRDFEHILDFLDEPNQVQKFPQDQTVISSQISFILINLYILGNQTIAKEFKQTGFGVLLNKYSAKIKMINALVELVKQGTIQLEPDIYNICNSYLITVLEKFKKLTIKKQRIAQPGEISFVHAIEQLIEVIHQFNDQKSSHKQIEIDTVLGQSKGEKTQSQELLKMKRNFNNFTIFEIDCLTNNWEKYLKLIDKLPLEVLKAFTHSVYAPKGLKQKIFQRMVRQNFMEAKCNISLKEFKQIIEITDDPQEVQLYIQYVFSTFGEDGKKMVMLMANQNKRIQKILLKDNDVQI